MTCGGNREMAGQWLDKTNYTGVVFNVIFIVGHR